MNKILFSHKSDLWKTPKNLYEAFMRMGYFDPCPENPTFDGLKIAWKEKTYVNPPYSQINKWVDKAIKEAKKGNRITMLLPARTDTKRFEKIVDHGAMFEFIRGRLHFNDQGPAPFPSVMITLNLIWEPGPKNKIATLDRRELH